MDTVENLKFLIGVSSILSFTLGVIFILGLQSFIRLVKKNVYFGSKKPF